MAALKRLAAVVRFRPWPPTAFEVHPDLDPGLDATRQASSLISQRPAKVNVKVSRQFTRPRGAVSIVVTVDGQSTSPVTIDVQ